MEPEGKLDRLLEVEARLGERIVEAEAEAARIVAEAEAEARDRREGLVARLEADAVRLREEIEAEARRAIAAAREEAARRVERFRSLPEETVRELADGVVARIVALDEEGGS